MKSLCMAVSAAGLLFGASTASAAGTPAPQGVYTLVATVKTVSSANCPYKAGTQNLAGYTMFGGFAPSGPNKVALKNWVIAISPATGEKYSYSLAKAQSANGSTLTFGGAATYGNAAEQFTAHTTGTYKLIVNPITLASTLTVTGPTAAGPCTITYSITFTRGIPKKFLDLL